MATASLVSYCWQMSRYRSSSTAIGIIEAARVDAWNGAKSLAPDPWWCHVHRCPAGGLSTQLQDVQKSTARYMSLGWQGLHI